MNIRFNLKSANGGPIRVVISHNGKSYRKAIGLSCEKWNNRSQRSGDAVIDGAVKKLRQALEGELNEFSCEDDINSCLDRISGGKWHDVQREESGKPRIPSFERAFAEWAANGSESGTRQKKLAMKIVTEIMPRTKWSDIDSAWCIRLINGFDKRKMPTNYKNVVMRRLKTFLGVAVKMKWLDNMEWKDYSCPKEPTFAIALSEMDVQKIVNAEFDKKHWNQARDLFILGIYTAARFSDYSRLSMKNIVNGKIDWFQQKTDRQVLIPCKPIVREVLERNHGRAPKMCSVRYNLYLKEIAREVGLTQVVQVPPTTRNKLGKKAGEDVYKYELIASHTCRRTALTLLYRQGVPPVLLCKISGHSSTQQLMQYIRIANEDAEREMECLEFFK